MISNILESGFYTLKNEKWLNDQRTAGKVLAGAMRQMEMMLAPGISTKRINDIGEEYIRSQEGCIPTFKGYLGFPEAVCCSINKNIVHGIPKETDIIKDGDIIKLDCGVTYNGAIADMARTFAVGDIPIKYKLLIECCKKALFNSIDYLNKNTNARLGDIGYIIKKTADSIGASVITELTGHGISENLPHAYPIINNIGEKDKGLRLYQGMTFAIEPMLNYGSNKIKLENDNWTISLMDIGVHEEDTIFIHSDRVEVITN